MTLQVSRCCTVPKDPAYPNEDVFRQNSRSQRFVLCDGASESFNARLWANCVATACLRNGFSSEAWIGVAFEQYTKTIARTGLSWSQEAAAAKGSFCTVVSAELTGQQVITTSIGDSLFALFDGDNLIETWRYEKVEEFNARPLLIASNDNNNDEVKTCLQSGELTTVFDLNGLANPRILLLTDAIAAWLVSEKVLRGPMLTNPSLTKAGFGSLVHRERESGRMRTDDTTLVVLEVIA